MSLKVFPILCNAGFMNNYAYLLYDEKSAISAIVDASQANPIIEACEQHRLEPKYILVTHHHDDHTGGNEKLKSKYNLEIVVPQAEMSKIKGADMSLKEGDEFVLGESRAKIIGGAGHTKGHILYYFEQDKTLFTGDVLFNLNIGWLFEGTPEEMWHTLQKIKALPDDVRFYCGHEYTSFGLRNLPENEAGKKYLSYVSPLINQGLPTTGMLLGLEKKCNPFLQVENLNEFLKMF